jgi:protoporphyrinogen oxidase
MSQRVAVLGGGLAGLACAYELARAGVEVTVIEREGQPGGMAASFTETDGAGDWSWDFGPHRFHTNDPELLVHVQAILDGNWVNARRLSRIMLLGRLFDYPLQASNVLQNLPRLVLLRAFRDYFWVRFTERTHLTSYSDESFEGWVTRRFGRTMYELFFGRYTEKTWKMSPAQISGDWASQRISLLSLGDAVRKTLFRPRNVPRTLVSEFIYPERGGIGEIARGYVRELETMGSHVLLGAPVTRVNSDGERVIGIEYGGAAPGSVEADHYVSTIPVTVLALCMRPAAPEEVRAAVRRLKHASIVFVYLKLARPQVSPDNWIYIPDHEVAVHRISEFKNFSSACAPAEKTLICAEITCRVGDEHWRASDAELAQLASSDLQRIGLIDAGEVTGSFVRKLPHAYPIYDLEYRRNLAPVMDFVHDLANLQTAGRQGLFRYNNMDQSIEMGRRIARALVEQRAADHEVVASEGEYFG